MTRLKQIVSKTWKQFKPPEKLSLSEWADNYRFLSAGITAEPGRWRTDRAPYQKGMMDAISDNRFAHVVVMSSSQVGKSELILNTLGYFIDHDPGPGLLVQPTLDDARDFSRDRLDPMLNECPALRGKIFKKKSRDSANTMLHKKFIGGNLTLAGANSSSRLASRPKRIILLDEIDRYPHDADGEGSPIQLAIKRSTTFWNRKIVLVSTPTITGLSAIEHWYQHSDQRQYYVPCPCCSALITLQWQQIKWEEPANPWYECQECGGTFDDSKKYSMLKEGQWIAEHPNEAIAGFHINELYSPWKRWHETVADFRAAKDDPQLLKVWVNTALGESWEDQGEKVDPESLIHRREDYPRVVSEGAICFTAGVDVQDDRLECEIVAWSEEFESWGLDYQVFDGSPGENEVWQQLDTFLQRPIRAANGADYYLSAACIDTGGHFTQQAYEFCKRNPRYFAIKGSNIRGQPVIASVTKKEGRGELYTLGVDTIKDMLFSWITIKNHGPRYCHWRYAPCYGQDYFDQLTAEKKVTKTVKGQPVAEYVKMGKRNEALDCRVYGIAAVYIIERKTGLKKLSDRVRQPAQPARKQAPRVRSSGIAI